MKWPKTLKPEVSLGTANPAQAYEEQLRSANERLYSHSLELATRNKTLSLLRQLYQISIITFDPDELANKIVTIVREALEFELVCALAYDPHTDTLAPISYSRSDRLKDSFEGSHPFQSYSILDASKHAFFSPLLKGKSNRSTALKDIWGWDVPEEKLVKATEDAHIRSLIAYPLTIDGKLTDVLVLCFNRNYEELTAFEQESLESIVDVAAVALDRARLYKEVQRVNTELTESNRKQVTLIHFITHQLKGYVSKSRNIFATILEGDYGQVPEAMKFMIDEGFASSTKGAQTIQEILNAANIKSGKVAYSMASFDLSALVRSIVDSLKGNADAKGVALTVTLPEAPVMFTGDQMQLENALKNLVDNTIKYTPAGSIAVTLEEDAQHIRFSTKDTGVGITTEDMKHLFMEGGHGAESTKVNVDSTGFGLYIVKNIVEGHGGTVRADSEGAGKGSMFTVELPKNS